MLFLQNITYTVEGVKEEITVHFDIITLGSPRSSETYLVLQFLLHVHNKIEPLSYWKRVVLAKTLTVSLQDHNNGPQTNKHCG